MTFLFCFLTVCTCSWAQLDYDSERNHINKNFKSTGLRNAEWNITIPGYITGGNLILDEERNLIYLFFVNTSAVTPSCLNDCLYSDTLLEIDPTNGNIVDHGEMEHFTSFSGSLTKGGLHHSLSNSYLYLYFDESAANQYFIEFIDLKDDKRIEDWYLEEDTQFSLNRIVLDSKGNIIISELVMNTKMQKLKSYSSDTSSQPKLLWESEIEYPCEMAYCNIVIQDDIIYVLSNDGDIYQMNSNATILKFNAITGKFLNSIKIRSTKYWFVSGVTVSNEKDGYFYINLHDNDDIMHTLAYDKVTNKLIFDVALHTKDLEFNDCSPLVLTPDGTSLRFMCSKEKKGMNYVFSANSKNGKVEWSTQINKNEEECYAPTVVGMDGKTITACGILTTPKLYVHDNKGKLIDVLTDDKWKGFYESGLLSIDADNFLYYCVQLVDLEPSKWKTLCAKKNLNNL